MIALPILTSQLLLLSLASSHVDALLLYGCNLSDTLCEEGESCVADGLFGQCYSEDSRIPPPTILAPLDTEQSQLLQLELERLTRQGQDWEDEGAQCVLAYFKLSIAYNLKYDPNFCQVRSPSNIWALVQLIDLGLKEEAITAAQDAEVPTILSDDDVILQKHHEGDADENVDNILREISAPFPEVNEEDATVDTSDAVASSLAEILDGKQPDLTQLSDEELNELLARIAVLKVQAEEKEVAASKKEGEARLSQGGEVADDVAVDEKQTQQVLKKDVEKLGDVNLGLDPQVHNIVKGRRSPVSRVVGNRIYLKVNIKSEEQLLPLIEFLQNTIAIPNNLIFDDFTFEDGQLSLRISRFNGPKIAPKEKRIETVEGVAQAVYKRRKDIARFSGAQIDETGIGVGNDSVPVANAEQDWLFFPLLFVSVFTMTSLVGVLAVHVYKRRRGSNYSSNLRQLAHDVEGKSSLAYQDLCRQRMSEDGPVSHSKTSSTSSWTEEAIQSGIDISTGHVLLNFLQDSLSEPGRIDSQWEVLKEYVAEGKRSEIGKRKEKSGGILPYDETLVRVESDGEGTSRGDFLNASFIYDDDPRQAVFIASATPSGEEVGAFWKAIWQQGVCLIVNLTSLEEAKEEEPYWPVRGSHIHAHFEIHLVSEHIWSDDYLVRSFYLKNLRDGQTRTITQFHYVGWQSDRAPASPQSLLEFRRKVNKSYRGRSSPLLIHSCEGAGRTGVYCAVDIICARIQRGVKELDIAASVEHLRDQRPQLVKTADQYKFIYACVAQEVSALLKALPQ